jgi:hypothetical protein
MLREDMEAFVQYAKKEEGTDRAKLHFEVWAAGFE